MPKDASRRAAPVEPVLCLAGIFTTRRDLLEPIREGVLRGIDLTVDEADTLTLLYGIKELGWTAATFETGGLVGLGELRRTLVHDPGLFSRRIKQLRERGLIEARPSPNSDPSKRARTQAVRITDKGLKMIRPVWERYRRLAAKLLAGVPQSDLEAHCRVNTQISDAIARLRESIWT